MTHYSQIHTDKLKTGCHTCSLRELCLPHGIDTAVINKINALVDHSHVIHAGDLIFTSGDIFKGLYTLRAGSVKLVTYSNESKENIIGFYLAGNIIGIDGIECQKHKCSAIALETSSYCILPFPDIGKLCQKVPELNYQLLKIISREMTNDNSLILKLGKNNSEEKIAIFLITLSERYKRLGYSPYEFKLPMTRHDISNYLNLTNETICRVLVKFQRYNLLKMNNRKIKILDQARLTDIAMNHARYEDRKIS
jgi:CRP/FNR family transcriptional regulator, anaerobic regulatory protein